MYIISSLTETARWSVFIPLIAGFCLKPDVVVVTVLCNNKFGVIEIQQKGNGRSGAERETA